MTIQATRSADHVRFGGVLPPGRTAFIDGDTVRALTDAKPTALPVIERRLSPDAVENAALAFGNLADSAVRVARNNLRRGRIAVTGDGVVAHLIRSSLNDADAATYNDIVGAVIDTTGTSQAVIDAMRSLDDLGVLVLAGQPTQEMPNIDLYDNVHSRGLIVVGCCGPSATTNQLSRHVPQWSLMVVLQRVAPARLGMSTSLDALWYQLLPRV